MTLNQGIEVDDRLRTSAPDVYAAGDAAHCMGRTWDIVPPAQAQARVAAQNMVGGEAHYEQVTPYTSLKVVGIDGDSMGQTTVDDEDKDEIDFVRYARPETHTYVKVLLRDEVNLTTEHAEGTEILSSIMIFYHDIRRNAKTIKHHAKFFLALSVLSAVNRLFSPESVLRLETSPPQKRNKKCEFLCTLDQRSAT